MFLLWDKWNLINTSRSFPNVHPKLHQHEYSDESHHKTNLLVDPKYFRRMQYFYYSSTSQPSKEDPKMIICIYEHWSIISWDNFIRSRISKCFKIFMSQHYNNIGSKNEPDLWVNPIVSTLINIHLDTWKTYCDLIHDNKIKRMRTVNFTRTIFTR